MQATYKCPKCSGLGRLSCYSNVLGGVCFSCGGKGVKQGKAPAPSVRWAVLGIERATGARVALYFKRAKTADAAINAARNTMAGASSEFKEANTLDGAIAVRAEDWERDPAVTLYHAERAAGSHAALTAHR